MQIKIMLYLAIAILVFSSCKKVSYNYVIENYKAVFEIQADSTDVKVGLEIDYKINDYTKDDGFKFVGNNTVKILNCSDDTGKSLICRYVPMKESKIVWYFSAVSNSNKKVFINFIINDLLRYEDNVAVLDAPWVGVFMIPVYNASFELILPTNKAHEILKAIPENYKVTVKNNKKIVIIKQNPLIKKEFYLKFKLI